MTDTSTDDLRPGPDESLDRLGGDWWIFQLARGHRFSTDDLACAWRGSLARPDARRVLDIGAGIGSVGLSTLRRLGDPTATLTMIEAQDVSVGLARRTLRYNRLEDRVRSLHGDLRDPTLLDPSERFDLVTGSPPYIPPGKGIISSHPQRAACRFELRGSVFDYCAAARTRLAPGGRFCFVMAAADPRTEAAPVEAGLAVVERWDFTFRSGQPPMIATLVCALPEDVVGQSRAEGALVVRGPDGEWTPEYLDFRRAMGAPPEELRPAGRRR